jgi:hypothetical protein
MIAGYRTFRSKKRSHTYIFSNHMISGATEKVKQKTSIQLNYDNISSATEKVKNFNTVKLQ